jgi:hypothetical protein
MYGNAREGGCAQARPPLLRSYSVERILNRCSVVRPIVDTSTTSRMWAMCCVPSALFVIGVVCLIVSGLSR